MITGFSVPLVVAVTGHRDLVPAELPGLEVRVREFLSGLRDERADRGVTVLSGLAEGADRIVVEVAHELALSVVAVLPMPADLYVADFETPESRAEFERLYAAASDVLELPIVPGSSRDALAADSEARSRQYAQLGVFLSAHCHILLALWDGRTTEHLGGTAQVVRFHQEDVMPGYTPPGTLSRNVLADDESDLVYHVVCSRNRSDGHPAEGLTPLDCWWISADQAQPRTREMPARHRRVFDLTSTFSRDAWRFAERIAKENAPLVAEEDRHLIPAGAETIEHGFRIADWLALRYQRLRLHTLRATHLLGFLMGLAYLLYLDVLTNRLFIVAFVGLFLIAALVHVLATRGEWHRKYLDYRTLAEGLRVQFYWAVAGVTSETRSKYGHDNFLQRRDADLGWIRNVMRVTGTECDIAPNPDRRGLEYVISRWIGDEDGGQLGYFRRKARERSRRYRWTEELGNFVLWMGILATALFILAPQGLSEVVHDPVTVALGVLLLGLGVRQSFSFNTADKELTRQYEFMQGIFEKAHRRVARSEHDHERRLVLKTLGDAALEEHSEWILMHRERTTDQNEVWRMSG